MHKVGKIFQVLPRIQVYNEAKSRLSGPDSDRVSASFYLGNEATPPSARTNHGMKRNEWNIAFQIVCERQAESLAEWRRIHGTPEEAEN